MVGKALTAAALAAVMGFSSVQEADADVSGLTPCSESKGYAKRQKNEVKGLQKRLKQVQTSNRITLSPQLLNLSTSGVV